MAELMIVFLPVHLALIAWNKKSIDEHTMVFDGGNHHNPPLLPPPHGTNSNIHGFVFVSPVVICTSLTP